MRTEVCNWEKKLQEVFDDNTQLLRPRTNLEVVVESVSFVDLYTIISLPKVILCN